MKIESENLTEILRGKKIRNAECTNNFESEKVRRKNCVDWNNSNLIYIVPNHIDSIQPISIDTKKYCINP